MYLTYFLRLVYNALTYTIAYQTTRAYYAIKSLIFYQTYIHCFFPTK